MHILVTGANGYIGARLLERLRSQNALITVLGSAPVGSAAAADVVIVPWRLGQDIPAQAFRTERPVDAVIHLAHDWNTAKGELEQNRQGTMRLLQAVRANHIKRFIFVSSLSARPDALNRYGRVKASIEQELRAPAEIAVRLGLVYGGPSLGLYGTMLRITRLPILPMIDSGKLVQPIHLDEVCSGLIAIAQNLGLSKPVYGLAASKPISFGAFLKILARARHGRRLMLFPVPRFLALWAADLSAKLPLIPTIDRERVLGMAGIRVQDTASDLHDLQLDLRPVETGVMSQSAATRRLVGEGAALLHYCGGTPVKKATIRLYMRGLRYLGEAEPLHLPIWALHWPTLIRLIDGTAKKDSPLKRRLFIAARIAESGREPAERFHMTQPENRLAVLVRLVALLLVETPLLAVRMLRGGRR